MHGMKAIPISAGDVFGDWTVLAQATSSNRKRRYECVCKCGNVRIVHGVNLTRGSSTQCVTCANKHRSVLGSSDRIREHKRRQQEIINARKATGRSTRHSDPLYDIWHAIRGRCFNPNNKSYKNYGGRGITMEAEWRNSFDAFCAGVGPRPSSRHSLDRIDNDKGYETGNVRWATTFEQANNKRNNKYITAFGKTQTVSEWSSEIGIAGATISARLKKGLDPEDALAFTRSYLAADTTGNANQARREFLVKELAALHSRIAVVEQELAKYRDDA